MPVTDEDRYLFDALGYVVIRGALAPEEVARLNALLDEHPDAVDQLTQPKPKPAAAAPRPVQTDEEQYRARFLSRREVLYWGREFRDLVDHPAVLGHLEEWVDEAVRLDHYYPIFKRPGAPDHELHFGGTPHIPVAHYFTANDRIQAGFTVVTWALTDMPRGRGAFACVPGSHKAIYPLPEKLSATDRSPVLEVPLEAGDALIFTEALTHGAFAWSAPFHRRSLLFKYCPGHMVYAEPDWPEELLALMTERQRRLFEPGYVSSARSRPPLYYRPRVDGEDAPRLHADLEARIPLRGVAP